MTYFTNENHKAKYEEFLKEANVREKEQTTKAVLYLLSSVPVLADNIHKLFELRGKYINPDGIEDVMYQLSTGHKTLLAVAFNLYNGYKMEGVDISPYSVLSWLDIDLKKTYMQSLSIKMGSM